jgi:hypothetical protein
MASLCACGLLGAGEAAINGSAGTRSRCAGRLGGAVYAEEASLG